MTAGTSGFSIGAATSKALIIPFLCVVAQPSAAGERLAHDARLLRRMCGGIAFGRS